MRKYFNHIGNTLGGDSLLSRVAALVRRTRKGYLAPYLLLLAALILSHQSVAQSPPAGTVITNIASATHSNSYGVEFPPVTAVVSTGVAEGPVLQLSNTVFPTVVEAGESLTYTLIQVNTGNTDATGVVLTSELAAKTEFVSATGGGVYNSATNRVTWPAIDLSPSGFESLSVEARVVGNSGAAVSSADIVNVSSTVSAEAVKDTAISVAKIGQRADLQLIKIVNRQITFPGGDLSYEITLTNTGNLSALNSRITDNLPNSVELNAETVDLPFTLKGQSLVLDAGDLLPGESVTARFSVRVSDFANDGEIIQNRALASAAGSDFVASNETHSKVVKDLDIVIEGLSTPESVLPGDEIHYRLKLTNIGSELFRDLVVRQALPPDTGFVSIDNRGQFVDDEALWEIDALIPGETIEFNWTVQTASSIPQNFLLRAAAFVENQRGIVAETEILTLILEPPAVEIAFYDAQFDGKISVYYADDSAAYIQVRDALANADDALIETVSVKLSNAQAAVSPLSESSATASDNEQVTLTETGPESGIFRGNVPFNPDVANPGDGSLFVEANSRLQASYVDSLNQVQSSSDSIAIAIFQPASAVFNSITGEVVPGIAVQLLTEDGGDPVFADGSENIFISNHKGEVFFPELLIGPGVELNLRIDLTIPSESDLRFPSAITDEKLPGELSSGKQTRFGVGSRGEVFTLSNSLSFVSFDLPVDPPEGKLRLDKSASESRIAVGEIITYELEITNNGSTPVLDTRVIDQPPTQFRLIPGSTVIEQSRAVEPEFVGGILQWQLGVLDPGDTIEVTYQMMIGVDARQGEYVNTAFATGNNLMELVQSNTASHQVRVTEGIFTRNGTILGRIFIDLDGDGVLDEGEPGVQQAIVLMQDGSYVTSDGVGRFSFRNIRPGQHVLRLDDSSLPLTVEPAGDGGRFLNRRNSQWIEMNASGLVSASFPVVPISDSAREEILADMGEQAQETTSLTSEQTPETGALKGVEARGADLQALVDSFESNELSFVNPGDGQQLSGMYTDIQIKFPSGGSIQVQLNGEDIDEANLGTIAENPIAQVSLHEYAAVRLDGNRENVIRVSLLDPFGNERGSEEIRVYPASAVTALDIAFDDSVSPIADGRTVIPVTVALYNQHGNLVTQLDMISVDVRPARLVEEDADPVNPGHQIRAIDGIAHFSIRAPRQPGATRIQVQIDDILEQSEIRFLPYLSGLMIVGSGDVTIGAGSIEGDAAQLDNIFGDKIEDGALADGHLGIFVNGALSDKILITAHYDSAKQRPDDFFFAREQQVDEESIPAITGDGSQIAYNGSSRDKLFLRLDREESHALWGDYRTQLGDEQLSFYNRTFTGFRTEIREENFRVTGFAAEMEQDQVVDALTANGTSGYYFLTRGPLILGSERVVLETRDRLRPDVVLSSVTLVRNTDYDIDYYEGSILTRSPIPTYDEALNPNILIVTYEVENKTNDQWAYGARIEYDILENLTVAASAVVEESTIDDYGLQGVDVRWLAEGINTQFTAEYAQTQSVFDENGSLNSEDGTALRFSFQGTPLTDLDLSGYYQDVDEFFTNVSALNIRPGTESYGVEVSYKLNEQNRLSLTAYEEIDELYENNFSHIGAGWQGQLSRFLLGAELYSDEFDSNRIAPSALGDGGRSANEEFDSATNRYPFDSTAEQISQDLGVRLSARTDLGNKFHLNLSHSQDVKNTSQSLSYAKLNYDLSEERSLYLMQRFDRYEDRDESRSLVGLQTAIAYNTSSFVEYQMEDTVNGRQIRQSIGLRNLFELSDNFFGNASYERLNTLSGEGGANRPDGYATTVSTTYLPTENWRFTTRAELRDETDLKTQLGELGLATNVSEELSILGRARYFSTEGESSGQREDLRVSLGLAWRPATTDRFQALARLDWWQQDRESEFRSFSEVKLYGAIEGIYQVTDDFSLSAKYAGKQYELDSYSFYNDLYSVRGSYLLNDRWELGATLRMLNEHDFDNKLFGGSIDVGFRLWEFIWLTVGYSLDDFDADLSGAGYSGQGVFAKFRFKFDENILNDF